MKRERSEYSIRLLKATAFQILTCKMDGPLSAQKVALERTAAFSPLIGACGRSKTCREPPRHAGQESGRNREQCSNLIDPNQSSIVAIYSCTWFGDLNGLNRPEPAWPILRGWAVLPTYFASRQHLILFGPVCETQRAPNPDHATKNDKNCPTEYPTAHPQSCANIAKGFNPSSGRSAGATRWRSQADANWVAMPLPPVDNAMIALPDTRSRRTEVFTAGAFPPS